ncbi:MAG TPA: hypothetical protein VG365_09575 [Solirubrobacteraceae bacterium]|nr:hypothetical protein [Solirubrobacteraceae bacterium]
MHTGIRRNRTAGPVTGAGRASRPGDDREPAEVLSMPCAGPGWRLVACRPLTGTALGGVLRRVRASAAE